MEYRKGKAAKPLTKIPYDFFPLPLPLFYTLKTEDMDILPAT